MTKNKFTASVLAIAIAVGTVVVSAAPAQAAGLLGDKADMGDLFVLNKLFSAGNSRIFSNNGSNLGNLFILDKLFNADTTSNNVVAVAPSVADRVAGKIVLQVESHGEAWYVSPVTKQRTYLDGPASAYQTMAKMALGISNSDFNAINTGDTSDVPSRVVGRFLIKTEDHGKLYYVNPTDKSITMIAGPADAQAVITKTGIGISNSDLNKITVAK